MKVLKPLRQILVRSSSIDKCPDCGQATMPAENRCPDCVSDFEDGGKIY